MSDFIKIIDYSSILPTGEKAIKFVSPGERRFLEKTADLVFITPKTKDFISSIKPTDNKLFALINAMGATEYYGCNINGDAFYEQTLKDHHPSFVTDGTAFMHHANKDPSKGYGKVLFSDYNDAMHRVELVVEYLLDRLERRWIEKINNGDPVSVSMGCRVPYDVCSICSNRAKSPTDYCKHLKDEPGLGRMLPDGRKAFAINTEPTFFDISIVTVPADPTARILVKIANSKSFYFYKSASERAEEEGMIKEITPNTNAAPKIKDNGDNIEVKDEKLKALVPSILPALEEIMNKMDEGFGPNFPSSLLDGFATQNSDPLSLLQGLIKKKTYMRPNEVQRIILVSSGKKDIADRLDQSKTLLMNDPSSIMSKLMGSVPDFGAASGRFNDAFSPRSMEPENLKQVVIKICIGPMDKTAATQMVPVSEDYKILSGEKSVADALAENRLPSLGSDPITSLKTYLALGSIVGAFSALLGKELSPSAMIPLALLSAISGPGMGAIANDPVARPVQQMYFPNEGMSAEESMMNTLANMDLIDVNRRGDSVKISCKRAKTAGLPVSGFMNTVVKVPIALAAAKATSEMAKNNAMEEAQFTGKYEPSLLSRPELSFLLTLPMIMKFANARTTTTAYLQGMQKRLGEKFASVFKKNKSEIYGALTELIYKKR